MRGSRPRSGALGVPRSGGGGFGAKPEIRKTSRGCGTEPDEARLGARPQGRSPCGPSFHWRAPTVSGVTTARPRTNGRRRVSWSSRNTVGGVVHTLSIGSRSRNRSQSGHRARGAWHRPVAQLAEHRSPKPGVGGSIPSWPASCAGVAARRREMIRRRERVIAMELTARARTARLVAAEWGSRGPRVASAGVRGEAPFR